MKNWLTPLLSGFLLTSYISSPPAFAQSKQDLMLVYPPKQHQTTAEKIFLIGTASATVYVNGQPIEQSAAGHFAPSFPLQMGDNQFTIRSGDEQVTRRITRISPVPTPPSDGGFAPNSLFPSQPITRQVGETICLEAVGTPQGEVTATVAEQIIPLLPQAKHALPPNYAVLTGNNAPLSQFTQLYQGCFKSEIAGNLGNPIYTIKFGDQTITASDTENITILTNAHPQASSYHGGVQMTPIEKTVVEVTAEAGAARTGPGTSYSRLTPLPKGTRATVTGREGKWLRLGYGAWIDGEATRVIPDAVSPQTFIRSIKAEPTPQSTEIHFPLQVPVPVRVQQEEDTFTLTLHHTIAQTDTIHLDDDPLIERLDWQQIDPETVQYTFHLKSDQQWGYNLRYEGPNLILSLKHPPTARSAQPLAGMRILVDPGHGGEELGAKGPTGYPEKAVNLKVSQLLQAELEQRGATVYMTRETDKFVSLADRIAMINDLNPAIALSIHYNALPDDGDAINTSGIGAFWYNPPAHDLAVFLHNYLVEELNRDSYGVFWNTLALTRPHTTLAVLLELGFMINPTEFEWVMNPAAQEKLAGTIADGVEVWWKQKKASAETTQR
ncbi:cell wall hydrolase/autolysin [Halothece sp. PCC 7418]|uniref:N-acetylmuramoyl-L-alanine amidase n=1 Tax=Halothece sp. (strain PCC 7418) TaxID=65093 RepID=UPI0002A07ADA|nr:N-acetylmuramoyl-L-alanine amidase [Halothece sp. PCC 7418]AFZ45342.1 cell wall hydrolase/autolysin [Halothece sp. PCC 7418]